MMLKKNIYKYFFYDERTMKFVIFYSYLMSRNDFIMIALKNVRSIIFKDLFKYT